MVGLTTSFWHADIPESNYAGGLGGIAYAGTQPTLISDLTAIAYLFNDLYQAPQIEYRHTVIRGPSLNVASVFPSTQEFIILPASRKQYVINSTMLDRAIAGIAGELPASWASVFYDMQRLRFAYGCYLTEYIFHTHAGQFASETVFFNSYNVVACTYIGVKKDFTITGVKSHDDFTILIDGVAISHLIDLTLTIRKKYTENKFATTYMQTKPYFEHFELIEVEIITTDYPAWILDGETEAVTTRTLSIAGWGKTLTLAAMKIKQNGNTLAIPRKGMKDYNIIFEMGGNVSPITT